MKKLTAIAFAAAALAFAAGKQTFTGTITDTMCGGDHSMMHMTDNSRCTIACVRAGAKYALWDGKKAYVLSDQKTPEQFAAKKVTVTGALSGDTIQVDSIKEAK